MYKFKIPNKIIPKKEDNKTFFFERKRTTIVSPATKILINVDVCSNAPTG